MNDYIAQGGPLSELVFKSVDPNTNPSDLSDLENFQLHAFARGMFQRLEAQYFLYRNGTLELEIWENRKSYNRGILDLPIYSAWWKLEVENAQYTKEFINEINAANKGQVLFMQTDGNTKDV